MSGDSNCIFDLPRKTCKPSEHPSFRGIFCDEHLPKVFGVETYAFQSFRTDQVIVNGPYLHVPRKVEFPAYTVIFPEREFLDQQMGALMGPPRNTSHPAENPFLGDYKLSTPLQEILHEWSHPNKIENEHYYEILRNMFVLNPTTDVNMAYKANIVKVDLLKQVSKRLNAINTQCQNAPWYMYFKNSHYRLGNITSNDLWNMDNISDLMKFLLFNMHSSAFLCHDADVMQNSANCVYLKGKGIVTTHDIFNPTGLCIYGSQDFTPLYGQLKGKADLYKNEQMKLNISHLGDSQNRRNLVARTKIC